MQTAPRERRGAERHWVGEADSSQHWFVESRPTGWLARAQGPVVGAGQGLARILHREVCSRHQTPQPRQLEGQLEPRQHWGLVQVCLLPGPFGSAWGRVPPCGSAEPVPISLARLLWLPERWPGGCVNPILGASTLPPDSLLGLLPFGPLTPAGGSLSSRLEELRSESLSLSLETTLPRAHV